MSQAESRLSRNIMRELRAHGWFCFKVHGGPTMMAGLNDIIACVDGKFVGLETKMPSERKSITVRQRYVHQLIRDAGGVAVVVCSVKEAVQVCQEIADSIPKRRVNRSHINRRKAAS